MIIVYSFIAGLVTSVKTWISNTFYSGWENLSNQIILLLSLIDVGANMTIYDQTIKPIVITGCYSKDYCDKTGIDYTRPIVGSNLCSFTNGTTDYEITSVPATDYGFNYLYIDSVKSTRDFNKMLPTNLSWDSWNYGKCYGFNGFDYVSYRLPQPSGSLYAYEPLTPTEQWRNVSMIMYNSKFYISIYNILYILDSSYEIESVWSLPVPVKYWFTDDTHLYFYTLWNMVAKCS